MSKNKELKIYEFLGIKYFKKIIMKFHYLMYAPLSHLLPKEDRQEFYNSIRTNYKIGKVSDLKDIKTFKKNLYFNGAIHSVCAFLNFLLFFTSLNVPVFIINLVFLLINTYCVMLQRYNCIRIDNMLARCEHLERRQKERLQQSLQEDEFGQHNINHKIINSKENIEKEISFEEFLNTASISQLKEYMNYLRNLQEGTLSETMPLNKNEILEMTLKRKKASQIRFIVLAIFVICYIIFYEV